MQNEYWPQIAVMGAGAVGCYFGGMFARAGAPVTLIGRAPHVEAIETRGLILQSVRFMQRIPVAASADPGAARTAELVLFCVKAFDTEEAANLIAPALAPRVVLVSLQNGVDNCDRIRCLTGIEAIPACVYVAVEMVGPGRVRHAGRGDLIIGDLRQPRRGSYERRERLDHLAALFARAEIPCRVSENIGADLWTKLIMNCAYNAISALSHARYGRIVRDLGMREVMRLVIKEAVAVARADGIAFGDADIIDMVLKLAETMPDALSSTAQDLARGKRTEIDSLNGYVACRGAKLGIATPVNRTLHALVKLREKTG